jgi:hypothetical protein
MEYAIPLAGRAPTVPWFVWVRLLIVGALIFLWERRAVPPPSPSITRNQVVVDHSTKPGTTKSHVMCEYGPEIVLVLPVTKRCPVALKGLPDAPK